MHPFFVFVDISGEEGEDGPCHMAKWHVTAALEPWGNAVRRERTVGCGASYTPICI